MTTLATEILDEIVRRLVAEFRLRWNTRFSSRGKCSMDEARRDLVRAWLVKARRDLLSARVLAAGIEPILDTAIYHCQQAAEKAIKAATWELMNYTSARTGSSTAFGRFFEKTPGIATRRARAISVDRSGRFSPTW